jgi:hypothetical protein
MATWNLESVGTKGYGGGGSYFCARAAKAILKRKEERDEENYDGIGVFKDPLLDSVYGQCSSTTRPLRQSMQDDPHDVADLLKPTGTSRMISRAMARYSTVLRREITLSHAIACRSHTRCHAHAQSWSRPWQLHEHSTARTRLSQTATETHMEQVRKSNTLRVHGRKSHVNSRMRMRNWHSHCRTFVAASRRVPGDGAEDIQVVFEEPFTSRGGRKGVGIPLVCIGSGEHTVYVLQVTFAHTHVHALSPCLSLSLPLSLSLSLSLPCVCARECVRT